MNTNKREVLLICDAVYSYVPMEYAVLFNEANYFNWPMASRCGADTAQALQAGQALCRQFDKALHPQIWALVKCQTDIICSC